MFFLLTVVKTWDNILAPCLRLIQTSGGKTDPKRPICRQPMKIFSPVCSEDYNGEEEEEEENETRRQLPVRHLLHTT